jgi:NAD(P)-dependent dehydrogenase (short-subunit alcohol dehydrogenase family)
MVDTTRHTGRVALITGAASGIGRACFLRLAQEGAAVVGCDVDQRGLDEACASATTVGGRCDVVRVDLRKLDQIEALVRGVLEMHSRIDILANAAGVFDGFVALHEMSDDEWDRVLGVNLTAPMQLCRAVLPHMRAAGGGAIVNVASIAALGGNGGAAYTVSKHGLLGLSKSIAWMYRDEGIRCNVVCPGVCRDQHRRVHRSQGRVGSRTHGVVLGDGRPPSAARRGRHAPVLAGQRGSLERQWRRGVSRWRLANTMKGPGRGQHQRRSGIITAAACWPSLEMDPGL